MALPLWAWGLIGFGVGGILLGTMSNPNLTAYSMEQIRAALEDAWPNVVGGDAPDVAIQMLGAHVDLETGSGRSCMGNNLGNFKAYEGWTGATTTFQTTEIVNGKTISILQTFQAWPTLAQGAAAYLSAMHSHFTKAWPFVLTGDTSGFAQGLKDQGYYTADEGAYAAGLVARGAPPLDEKADDS